MDDLFSKPRNDPILQAIIDAQADERCIGRLFDLLEPVLQRIASRIASQLVDDAVQAAKVRIWRKLHKIDLSRPETAKSFAVKAGVSGMRDEVRRWLRQHSRPMAAIDNEELLPAARMALSEEHFEGILELYLAYVDGTGDFHGAHAGVADILEVSTARASTLFHEASKLFIDKLKAEGRA